MPPAKITVDQIQAQFEKALALHQTGAILEARQIYTEILESVPDHFDSLHLLGVSFIQKGEPGLCVGFIEQALKINPKSAVAFNNLGKALHDLKRYDESIASCDKALALNPNYAEALSNRGNAQLAKAQYREALSSFDQALKIAPNFLEAHYNRGGVLLSLHEPETALASFDRALQIQPRFPEAHYNRGNALRDLHKIEEALSCYQQAIALRPNYAEAYNNLADALMTLSRPKEALAAYNHALQIRPDHAETHYNIGNVLQAIDQPLEALKFYDHAIALKSDFAAAYNNRGNVLADLKQLEQAVASYEKALALNPDYEFLLGTFLHTKMRLCDWADFSRHQNRLLDAIAAGQQTSPPFPVLSLTDSPELQRLAAESYTQAKHPSVVSTQTRPRVDTGRKIRLGYVSSDFREHAVTYLISGLIRNHDRQQFEVFGIDLGNNDQSPARQKIIATFDQCIPAVSMTDDEIANTIRGLEIDVLIDLNGHTKGARTGIFARRPAPIQINYLGFPGTMGAPYIDYIIADQTLIPQEYRSGVSEKIIDLPGCFQVNDDQRQIAPAKGREYWGLDPDALVFGCFNQPSKITPDLFDTWLTLLEIIPNSMLWLLAEHPAQVNNLRSRAVAHGIAPERLVFAHHVPYAEHLSRYAEIDLVLDSFPFNGGTTTSDALWGGCPVLTLAGKSLASRMGASLLSALGLHELITGSLKDYLHAALRISQNRPHLAQLRNLVQSRRNQSIVFDSPQNTRHFETAIQGCFKAATNQASPENAIESISEHFCR